MKKIPLFYVIWSVVVVIALLCTVLIPETGKITLLNEVFSIFVIGFIIAMLMKSLIILLKTKNMLNILIVAVVVLVIGGIAGIKSVKTIKDFVYGPEWITISNCELERRSTSRGIFSINYYLKGEDSNGNLYRFSLSGNEYEVLNGVNDLSVLCYKNTGRIVEIQR